MPADRCIVACIPRPTFGACARHFMYYSPGEQEEVESSLSFAPVNHPAPFFSRATGVFMGLLYDRSRPLGHSYMYTYTRAREVREEYNAPAV